MLKPVTYTLPTFWATALFYGDLSGFEGQADEKPFADFCEYMMTEHGTCDAVDCSDEPHFTTFHHATRFGVLACDVLEYTFLEHQRGAA